MIKQKIPFLLLAFGIYACYFAPEIAGFDTQAWKASEENCDDYRSDYVGLIIDQQDKLLSKNQNEVEALLGTPTRHQLYSRNQKFFFYALACSTPSTQNQQELLIRFDALGRVRELQVLESEQ